MIEFQVGNLHTYVNKKKATKEELSKIHKLLSVQVPGSYFVTRFRRGLWDGYKRFFNLVTSSFYSGLLPLVKRELGDEYKYEVVDARTPVPHKNNDLILNGIELRDYQEKIVHDAVHYQRGIISAPPNAGKTEIACGIIKVLGLPANFLTHRLGLLMQTKSRMEKRLGIEVGILGGGKEEIKEVNVLSVASLHKKINEDYIKNLLENTPVIISDECHRISSKTWETCLKSSNAYYRYGLSATALLRDNVSNMLVRGLTGDEISGVTNQELIEWGVSAKPSVFLMSVSEPQVPSIYTFDQAYDYGILFNEYRNSLIVNTAQKFLGEGKSVFILVWRIEHGKILKDIFESKGVQTDFISGEGSIEHTNKCLKMFDNKELKCLISSTISDEGIDVPGMDVLIMGVGFKAPARVVQRVGRGLRKKREGENVVSIVDFIDFCNRKYLLKHSRDRCAEYVKMGINIYEVVGNNWDHIEER